MIWQDSLCISSPSINVSVCDWIDSGKHYEFRRKSGGVSTYCRRRNAIIRKLQHWVMKLRARRVLAEATSHSHTWRAAAHTAVKERATMCNSDAGEAENVSHANMKHGPCLVGMLCRYRKRGFCTQSSVWTLEGWTAAVSVNTARQLTRTESIPRIDTGANWRTRKFQ